MRSGPCAKRVVTATIVTPDGRKFVGTNACFNPQKTCPRGDLPGGKGYEMCRDICLQPGHAEEVAIAAAGDAAYGAVMYIEGIDWVCPSCCNAVQVAGIRAVWLEAPPHG